MTQRSLYIVSPADDWVFFLGSPMAAFWLGVTIFRSWLAFAPAYLLGVLIHAHLFIVFIRSRAPL